MIVGFSGFGFPKAHGAAFGLLAYQSTWLRVHYGPEFLCALLNEQPMGFYPPDALVHEAQRRGIALLPPDVNASAVDCTVATATRRVRIGLGYVSGVRADEVAALVGGARGRRAVPLARRPRLARRARGARRSSSSPGRARATRSRRRAAGRAREVAVASSGSPRPASAVPRRHPARAAARAARRPGAARARAVGGDDRRLRHDRA